MGSEKLVYPVCVVKEVLLADDLPRTRASLRIGWSVGFRGRVEFR
jgi:hypothetical protein